MTNKDNDSWTNNHNQRPKNILEILLRQLELTLSLMFSVEFWVLFIGAMVMMLIIGGGTVYLIIVQFACAPNAHNPDPCGAGVDIFSFIVVVAMILTVWAWFRLTK